MSVAALALALAVLVAPSGRGRRLHHVGWAPSRRLRHVPVLACGVGAVGLAAVFLPVSAVVAVLLAAATTVVRGRGKSAQRRRAQEARELQTALDVLVGELRIGAHPVSAFAAAATEVDGLVADSLRAVAARARLGADVAAGLQSVAATSAAASHWERLSVSWELAAAHGLAIGTLMDSAQRDIVERERFSARSWAAMAGARATAAVLAGLPVLGIGLGQLIGANPVVFLLAGQVGGWLLVIGTALACCGLLWSDRITSQVQG